MLLNIHSCSTKSMLINSLISPVSFMLVFSGPVISVQPAKPWLNQDASNSHSKLVNSYYFYSYLPHFIMTVIGYLLYYLTLHVVLPEEFIHSCTTVRVTCLQFGRIPRESDFFFPIVSVKSKIR